MPGTWIPGRFAAFPGSWCGSGWRALPVASRLPLRLHPSAAAEARGAYRWYRQRNPLLAEIFLMEVEKAMEWIAAAPHSWPQYRGSYRRFVLGRFPFSVVYQLRDESLEVLAVAHHRRRPGYWQTRE